MSATRSRKAKHNLLGKARLDDAVRWLRMHGHKKPMAEAYAKRYRIPERLAEIELIELGYGEILAIEAFEKAGIAWEYMVEPLSGKLVLVRAGTEEHEIYALYSEYVQSNN